MVDEAAIDRMAQELGDFIYTAPPKPYDGNDEFSIYCPKHENPATSHKPSAAWQPVATNTSFTHGVMFCHKAGCTLKRNAIYALKDWRERVRSGEVAAGAAPSEGGDAEYEVKFDPSNITIVDKATGKPISRRAKPQPEPDDESVAEYINLLLEDEKEHLDWLINERGFTIDTIKEYEWGWCPTKDCYIYPVYSADGQRHGMRLYDPFHLEPSRGQKPRDKKRWYATDVKHSNQLWGIKQANLLTDGQALVFEGETDTMLAHQDGFLNAVTQTGGAGTWQQQWGEVFRDKVVVFCYDADDAGRKGREIASELLKPYALAIRHIDLPDGKDYTTYRQDGNTVEQFQTLIDEAAEVWRRDVPENMPHEGKKLSSISQIRDVDNANRVIEAKAYIAGKFDTPYVLPKKVDITCGRNKGKKCETCPLGVRPAGTPLTGTFRPDQDDILAEIMDAETTKTRRLIAKAAGLKCDDIAYDEIEQWHAEAVSIQDPVGSDTALSSDSMFIAYNFYTDDVDKIAVSSDYRLVGRRVADPRSRKLMYVVWCAERVGTDLDKFIVTPSVKRHLRSFSPTNDSASAVRVKLFRKYKDVAANVTGIIGRSDMHLLYDLTMHSVIGFNFNGKAIDKGWLDVMVMGDTRTGKTRMVEKLNSWYGCGFLASGENASYAGLIGGSAEMPGGKRRMPDWGILPRHNGRAVAIDEASGLQEIISKMSSVRTSGIAEINKQGGGRVSAKVRLFWMTNPTPVDGSNQSRAIKDYRGGAVQAISLMVGKQEDIARFDMAMMTASDDVQPDEILGDHNEVENRYTSELCHDMVMFAWSRKPENITWAPGIEKYINRRSIELSNKYSPVPPLVQGANFNTKLARMCVALATMLYSVDNTGENVVVRKAHVDYICDFVQECYDDDMFGYGTASKEYAEVHQLATDSAEEVRTFLSGAGTPMGLASGPDVLSALKSFHAGYFDPRQFSDIVGGNAIGQNIITYFVDRGMMRRTSKFIDMSPELIQLLREV